MKCLTLKTLLISILIVFTANTDVFAQQRNSGWGRNSNYGRLFNPKTVETFTGTVLSVERTLLEKNMSYGVHLKVKTKSETISVHLGPAWFIDNQEIQFAKNDKVTVTGSRITYKNAPAIIVMHALKGNLELKLRDKNGYPVWSGWRRKGMVNKRNI
ncbi:DNA-binding protein [Flavivirga rizhaonensis]|uniref:DNA-binding protein n=1 Tax=Flavivirga rizhaonensis TaxID=2559571 RepID=A0A4S1E122_9FLAO|nr:DNA-binding protein [Flavivirga rizhaonensis]TGV04351.1 DNA-binding protein [Flavivirga rizhaonensis]